MNAAIEVEGVTKRFGGAHHHPAASGACRAKPAVRQRVDAAARDLDQALRQVADRDRRAV
jgi:hypothetical protein